MKLSDTFLWSMGTDNDICHVKYSDLHTVTPYLHMLVDMMIKMALDMLNKNLEYCLPYVLIRCTR